MVKFAAADERGDKKFPSLSLGWYQYAASQPSRIFRFFFPGTFPDDGKITAVPHILTNALKNNDFPGETEIEYLYLNNQALDHNAARDLSDALKTNTTLTCLDLFNNNIGSSGAQSIAEALKENRTLTLLDLAKNDIGDVGAQWIADALETNTGLATIYLDGNDIKDSGARSIATALEQNETLGKVYLKENHYDCRRHRICKSTDKIRRTALPRPTDEQFYPGQ